MSEPVSSPLQKVEARVYFTNLTGIDLQIDQRLRMEDGAVHGVEFIIRTREKRTPGGVIVPHA